jgi:hypothetical protein
MNYHVRSKSGALYTVIEVDDGRFTCDCPGWVFLRRGKPRGCKHTRAAEAGTIARDFQLMEPAAKAGGPVQKYVPGLGRKAAT